MKEETKTSRRKFFAKGLTTLAVGAASGAAIANVCSNRTAVQALGPFFPSPGTPEDPVRENPNPDVPIYHANDNDLTFVKGRRGRASGQVVEIEGRVLDRYCSPVAGASVIMWQASASGRYNHNGDAANQDFKDPRTGRTIKRELDPAFQYWGRTITDVNGQYRFKTIVPGFYPADLSRGWYRPPHAHFMVSRLGSQQLVTQMYFRGQDLQDNEWIQTLNDRDALLRNPDLSPKEQEDLIVDFSKDSSGTLRGVFDITI